MHLKLLRAAAAVAILGGTATFGLGTQAALAATTNVDCVTADLIYAMNNYTSGDTLVLAPHCTYWVTESLPSIMHTLTIQGNNASIVRTDSSDPFSIFIVGCTTGNLTLENVNVRNGGGDEIDGGAVNVSNSSAHLTVYGGTFSGNNAIEFDTYGGYGGAIYNLGTLTVSGAIFKGNGAEWGGAIYSDNESSTATLSHNVFADNDAYEGGAIYNYDNNMQVSQGNFRYNEAVYGGAIYNDWNLTVFGSLFAMNRASSTGGAIQNEDSLTVNHSLITVNFAIDGGGGIYHDGDYIALNLDQINQNYPDNCEPTNEIDGCVG